MISSIQGASRSETKSKKAITGANVILADAEIKGTVKFKSDVIIDGKIDGKNFSAGVVTIGPHATVHAEIRSKSVIVEGSVRCRRLIVKGHAEGPFPHPVQAPEVIIDGIVTGDIVCAQKLHLEKKSLLKGDIQTPSRSVSEGARHTGMVSRPRLPERYAKFGVLADIAGMKLPNKTASAPDAPARAAEPAPENPFRKPPEAS